MKYEVAQLRYALEFKVWHSAVANGGVKMTLETVGKAIHLRQRLYRARKASTDAGQNIAFESFEIIHAEGSCELIMRQKTTDIVLSPLEGDKLVDAVVDLSTEELDILSGLNLNVGDT